MANKILLIEPTKGRNIKEKSIAKRPLVPLWTLSLATYLKKKAPEIHVDILDGQLLSQKSILRKINQLKPEVVGLSPKFDSYYDTLVFARLSKSIGASVILGGHHATGLQKEILSNRGPYSKDYCVDGIIQQDGEKAFYEYVTDKPLTKINNLVYQTKQGIKKNPVESISFDELPTPEHNLVNLDDYFIDYSKRTMSIYVSRGCSWRKNPQKGCIFCPHMETGLRLKDPLRVKEEIESLILKYNCDSIRECSDDFLNSRKWFDEFFKAMNGNKILVPMHISTRADKIDATIIKKLRKINIDFVMLGIESMSPQSLSALSKGTTTQFNKRAVELLLNGGISTRLSFVIGAPGENKKTLKDTTDFIKNLTKTKTKGGKVIIRINTLTPVPNSLAWEMFLKKTKGKYQNKDLLNFSEINIEWIKYFCNIEKQDFLNTFKEIRKNISSPDNKNVFLETSI
jgi:radical SAM superfamily enzyme YgiQ (UPF0313 family)